LLFHNTSAVPIQSGSLYIKNEFEVFQSNSLNPCKKLSTFVNRLSRNSALKWLNTAKFVTTIS